MSFVPMFEIDLDDESQVYYIKQETVFTAKEESQADVFHCSVSYKTEIQEPKLFKIHGYDCRIVNFEPFFKHSEASIVARMEKKYKAAVFHRFFAVRQQLRSDKAKKRWILNIEYRKDASCMKKYSTAR